MPKNRQFFSYDLKYGTRYKNQQRCIYTISNDITTTNKFFSFYFSSSIMFFAMLELENEFVFWVAVGFAQLPLTFLLFVRFSAAFVSSFFTILTKCDCSSAGLRWFFLFKAEYTKSQ